MIQAPGVSVRACRCMIVAVVLLAAVASSAVADNGGRRSGNYLMVVPSGYAASAPVTQFTNAKIAQGFDVTTYVVPAGTSRTVIKDYIEDLYGTLDQPDYILLVGDTSGSSSTSTTIPHWVGTGDKGADTDWPYGCMPGGIDWYPDIPVGRFSVSSLTELQNIVTKSLFVEAGNFSDPEYVKRGAFLANPDTGGLAEPTHDWVIENYFDPLGYEGIRIYSSEGSGTADVTNAVNNGCLWTLYMGHSGSSGWWDPSFGQGNVTALSNAGLYGLVFGWSCNTAHYTYDECFGETWIRVADRGAAAYISASNYIYWGSYDAWLPSAELELAFFASFFEKGLWEIGPAWMSGLYKFLRDYGVWDGNLAHLPTQHTDICHNFFEEFVILGDPSLLLPQPFGFNLSVDPVSQDLCCPPDSEAAYTIDVGLMGEFDEVVTLTADGLPPGASVVFSVNGQIPPFTTVITIGDLIGAPAGDYNVIITGTSASTERSISAGLGISNDLPDQVTLLSPEDGARDVALMPTLSWEAVAGGIGYDVELATDAGFMDVVFSGTVVTPTCTIETALDMLTTYYWHVRGTNACGQGEFSDAFSFTTVNMIMPAFYDLLNGETGTYTYFDDAYDGDGDNSVPLEPLSNGLGDLTDGVIATQHWNVAHGPYVGWVSVDPTITFHFGETVNIDVLVLHLDDSGGGGGVYVPDDVTITMGDQTLVFPCSDPPGAEPFAFTLEDLGLSGDTLGLTLSDYSTSGYMMLSEVEFYGTRPEPCFGDLDGDGDVDLSDLSQLLAHYGTTSGAEYEDGDLDGDGDVDLADLAALLAVYGTNCD
jgi:hypothetical protein